MSTPVSLVLALVLLAGNAFFVGAEFALVSVRRDQVEPYAADGSRRARVTLRALEQVSLMMAGAQLGITICSLGLGAVAEPAVARLFESGFETAGLSPGLVHPVAFAVALALVVAAHMVLGEMVPKNVALAGPVRAATALGPPLLAVVQLLRPLIALLNLLSTSLLRLVRVTPQDEVSSVFTAAEVAGMLEESRQEGLLDPDEHFLLSGALEFADLPLSSVTRATDAMVSAADGTTVAELEQLCGDTGFSRFPVLTDAGGLAGYVHVKDVLGLPGSARDEPLPERLVRPLVSLPGDEQLRSALRTMQERGTHLARVLDGEREVGVAALEDVIEALIGEVSDAATGEEPGAVVRSRTG